MMYLILRIWRGIRCCSSRKCAHMIMESWWKNVVRKNCESPYSSGSLMVWVLLRRYLCDSTSQGKPLRRACASASDGFPPIGHHPLPRLSHHYREREREIEKEEILWWALPANSSTSIQRPIAITPGAATPRSGQDQHISSFLPLFCTNQDSRFNRDYTMLQWLCLGFYSMLNVILINPALSEKNMFSALLDHINCGDSGGILFSGLISFLRPECRLSLLHSSAQDDRAKDGAGVRG